MPTIQRSRAPGRVPDGIVAAVLACAIAGTAGRSMRAYVRHLADRHLALVTTGDMPFKYQTLTRQRAAPASGHVLPIYGSSELFCCGRPFRPTQVFASRPTGFDVLALGRAGTGDLFFAQTFAALGHDLRDKRVVVSDSPSWFWNRNGPPPAQAGSNVLPEVAYAFVFNALISLPVREIGARRMLAYPETLRDDPFLRRAVEDLAHPTRINLAGYAALAPLGRVAAWALEVRDAARTAAFLWNAKRRPALPPRPAPLDWVEMAGRGTRVAEAASTTNPFGFSEATYRELRRRPLARLPRARRGPLLRDRSGLAPERPRLGVRRPRARRLLARGVDRRHPRRARDAGPGRAGAGAPAGAGRRCGGAAGGRFGLRRNAANGARRSRRRADARDPVRGGGRRRGGARPRRPAVRVGTSRLARRRAAHGGLRGGLRPGHLAGRARPGEVVDAALPDRGHRTPARTRGIGVGTPMSDGRRVLRLTLYYLAIIAGLLLVHLVPDYRATPFIYQGF